MYYSWRIKSNKYKTTSELKSKTQCIKTFKMISQKMALGRDEYKCIPLCCGEVRKVSINQWYWDRQ